MKDLKTIYVEVDGSYHKLHVKEENDELSLGITTFDDHAETSLNREQVKSLLETLLNWLIKA